MFKSKKIIKHARKNAPFLHHWTLKRTLLHAMGLTLLFAVFWVLAAMGTLRTFLPNTFQFVGWPGEDKTYLILFQNNAELRPTGGFLTAFAILDFKNGLPHAIDFQDVYGEIDEHEYITPPYPLDVLLEKDSSTYAGHSFRDANFNPDFAQSVDEILSFFYLVYPERSVDGVVAVNFSVLEEVIGLYEPLRVGQHKFTEVNLFESLENAVSDIDRHNLEALSSRKGIIEKLAYTTLKKMISNPWKWRELSELVVQHLNEKEILVQFANDALSKKIADFGWDGTFPNPEEAASDMLAVNIANYGGMKSDRYLTRNVHYAIEITDQFNEHGQPLIYGNLEVILRHNGDYNVPLSGEYKGYLRAFIPAGSQLLESSTGDSVQHLIPGYIGWGDTLLMQPGETKSFNYRFQLNPAFLEDDHYALTLIKQPGTGADLYEVVVKTPIGGHVDAPHFDTRENVAFYQANLDHDTTLALQILPDELPPRLFWQELRQLDLIEISFAEPLDPSTAQDLLHYEVRDLNKNVPDIDDGQLFIDSVSVDRGAILLRTRGMTIQPEEHYEILIRNLRDQSGNPIQPNPRTVTVVQRLEE